MSWVVNQDELHITIGTFPQSKKEGEIVKPRLESELQMVKAALLYANRAELCSAASSALLALISLGDTHKEKRFETLKAINSWFPTEETNQNLKFLSEFYEKARLKRYTKKGQVLLRQFNRALAELWEEARSKINEGISEAGGGEIVDAVDSGLLKLYEFEAPLRRFVQESELRDFVQEYIDVVGNAVSNARTYPLFDEDTSKLISAGINAGAIPISNSGVSRSKEVKLATDLLARLPVFPQATVKELLDIRRELESPLQRFRSAMINFSQGIETAAWDKDFPSDAELVFRRDVAPAILDIEEAVKTNRFLSELVFKFADKPLSIAGTLATTALSALAVKMSNLPLAAVAALAVSPAFVAGSVIHDTYNKWREKQQGIERNSLFFYYKAGELLAERKYDYVSDKS